MPVRAMPPVIVAAFLLLGCGGSAPEPPRAGSGSAAAAPPKAPQVPGPAMRPAPAPRPARPAAPASDPVPPAPPPARPRPPAVVAEAPDDAPAHASPLERECLAYGPSGVTGRAGEVRFTMDAPNARFRPRSASFTRRVVCGFRGGKLFRAGETFYLTLTSHDRDNPGFSTGDPGSTSRYYVLCEGSLGTSRATFHAGQRLSFAENTFTLPCGHMIYPRGVTDPAQASRVSGAYVYKVRSARLHVRRGPGADRQDVDLAIDVVVANPFETLELRGRLWGEMSTAVVAMECGTQPRYTKQAQHPACS